LSSACRRVLTNGDRVVLASIYACIPRLLCQSAGYVMRS
jgi:hypothetical protein